MRVEGTLIIGGSNRIQPAYEAPGRSWHDAANSRPCRPAYRPCKCDVVLDKSALMAIAAAEPAPAAVITCARGLTTLPAAQTPRLLVRPAASTMTNLASPRSQPRPETNPFACGTLPGADEHGCSRYHSTVGQHDAGQILLHHQPCHVTVDHTDAARFETGPLRSGRACGRRKQRRWPIADESCVLDRAGMRPEHSYGLGANFPLVALRAMQ